MFHRVFAVHIIALGDGGGTNDHELYAHLLLYVCISEYLPPYRVNRATLKSLIDAIQILVKNP